MLTLVVIIGPKPLTVEEKEKSFWQFLTEK